MHFDALISVKIGTPATPCAQVGGTQLQTVAPKFDFPH